MPDRSNGGDGTSLSSDPTEDSIGDPSTDGIDPTAVREAAREALEAPARRDAAQAAVEAVTDVLETDLACVYLWHDDPRVLRTAAYTDAFAEAFAVSPVIEETEGAIERAFETGSVVGTDADVGLSGPGIEETTGWRVAPIGDEGVLVVLRPDDDRFPPGTRQALDLAAGYLEAGLARHEESSEGPTEDERLAALSRAFPDYAFLYDAEGRYRDVLIGWTNIQLYSRQELIGNTVHDVFEDDLADDILAVIESALETGDQQVIEYDITTPAGVFRYEGRAVPVNQEGDDDRVVLVAREINDRYERERELKRQNERLEEFASVVSHDLRNPLNAAEGYLDLAREAVEDPTALSHLEEIEASFDRMERLIDDLLSLARQGDSVEETEPVDIESVVREAWGTVSTDDGDVELEDDLERVLADEPRLRRLFENCFRNAAEHAGPEPSVRVGVLRSTREAPATDDDLHFDGFYVADDGPGIPEDEREKVLESGYTTSEDGTGLGLSIVRRIADAHGWEVAIAESESGGVRLEFTGVEPPS